MRPRRIEPNTLNAKYTEPTADEVQSIMLTFTIGQSERDGNLNFIKASAIGTDMLEVNGVLDVTLTTSAESTTGFALNAVYQYGAFTAPLPHLGMVTADIIVTNTTDVTVVVHAMVEVGGGDYTVTYPAEDPTDVISTIVDQDFYESEAVTFITP